MKYLTWGDIEHLVDNLAKQLENHGFNSIYGMPRGGLIPTVMISHRLGIPLIDKLGGLETSRYTLVIDDICDTGETLKEIYWKTATLHYKPHSIYVPDFYAKEIPNNQWINYPWEHEGALPIQDYKHNK